MDQQHNRDPTGRKTTSRVAAKEALAPTLLKTEMCGARQRQRYVALVPPSSSGGISICEDGMARPDTQNKIMPIFGKIQRRGEERKKQLNRDSSG